MIIATRSNAIYSSPRIEKYISFYKMQKLDYLVIGWDRKGENLQRENTIYYRKVSGYNIGGLKAAFHRTRWMIFLFRQFFKNKKRITTIHAFDLDTAFPACIFKSFIKKNISVIFDVCDWFSATITNENKFIKSSFTWMEKYTINHTDEVILCEPERIEQIPYTLKKKELIVPNIPSFSNIDFLKIDKKYQFDNDLIVFSYVGGFGKTRFLYELLDVAQEGLIDLLIAGYGNHELEEKCKKLSALSNIKYFGKVDYNQGLNIMFNSNIIYAMYSKANPNNNYAAPNKYYEAMMLGKPILTTEGISIARKVRKFNTGYVIEESLPELKALVISLNKEDMKKKGENANRLWETTYKNYIANFFNNEYIEILNAPKC